MLSRNVWMGTGLGLALFALAASPAGAGTAYRYTAADGSLAFTDDLERIPAQQRPKTETIRTGPLGAYARLTPQQNGERTGYEEKAFARLEKLRELRASLVNEEAALAQAASGAGAVGNGVSGFEATVEVNGSTIRLPAVGTGDEPLIVEEVRAKPRGKIVTRSNTVVRRGDEILMVVRGEQDTQIGVNDFYDERELDAGTWKANRR